MISEYHKRAQERTVFERLRTYKLRMLKRPTRGERRFKRLLIRALKGSNIAQFNRPIKKQRIFINNNSGYIADFYIPPLRLVIEIDGPYHESQIDYDKQRTFYFSRRGIKVIRFTNEETKDSETCLTRIRSEIATRQKELLNNYPSCFLTDKQAQREQISAFTDSYIKKGNIIKTHKLRKQISSTPLPNANFS